MTAPNTTDATTTPVPAPVSTETQSLLSKIESAAKADAIDEAKTLEPEIETIVRAFVDSLVARQGGLSGKAEGYIAHIALNQGFAAIRRLLGIVPTT